MLAKILCQARCFGLPPLCCITRAGADESDVREHPLENSLHDAGEPPPMEGVSRVFANFRLNGLANTACSV